jgi:hypothetical protein
VHMHTLGILKPLAPGYTLPRSLSNQSRLKTHGREKQLKDLRETHKAKTFLSFAPPKSGQNTRVQERVSESIKPGQGPCTGQGRRGRADSLFQFFSFAQSLSSFFLPLTPPPRFRCLHVDQMALNSSA